MEVKNNEMIVSSKSRPLWQSILAAILYTLVLVCIWSGCFRMSHPHLYTLTEYKNSIINIEISIFPLIFAVYFSINKKIYINFENKKIRNQYSFLLFNFNEYTNIDCNYLSVFYYENNKIYAVNMWKFNNEFNTICSFENKDSAIEFASKIAKKLNLDLLDATEKGNSKWL